MVRNLICDMGNVLIHFDPDRFVERVGVTDPQDRMLLHRETFYSADWPLMDWGSIDEEELLRRARLRLPERLWEAARRLIFDWDQPILPVAGMEPFLRDCKAAGLGLYLISNASIRFPMYWPRVPGSELFDGLVVSAQARCVKPMPEIYRRLLDTYHLTAGECLFVDDMPLNVAGAVQVGMQGFLFRGDVDALRGACRRCCT